MNTNPRSRPDLTAADQTDARTSTDVVALVVAGAVFFIGVSVMAGWHLHIRAIVQILPGVIPMQYNTALCFATLGASGFAFVARRGHAALPGIGGFFVALMGALVVFEYVAGVSLGIDTAFFYPWERTLSADPGRMALTSAISFVCAGGALVACSLRPEWLGILAIAHTLPLSFGLTSIVGYAFGITYVLPFRLGSQMAIHTALAFTIYGVAMLWRAWHHTTQGRIGLPAWSPGIAAVVVPVLFVAFSAAAQGASSYVWVLALVLTLVAAAMLAWVIKKLTGARVLYKGLALISVPLVFVLAFVLLLAAFRRDSEQAQSRAVHSKDVIAQAQDLRRALADAESGLRGYLLTGDPAFADPYYAAVGEIPESAERLQELVRDSPSQAAVQDACRTAAARLEELANMERLMRAGAKDQATSALANARSTEDRFRRNMATFIGAENQLYPVRAQDDAATWERFDWLLTAGAAADLLLACMLVLIFSWSIGTRLRVLSANALALEAGEELSQPIGGSDEIAQLDSAFHRMAENLREHTARLESANKELEAFSYSVSHDLRAPLRAIDGFARILGEDYGSRLPADGLEYLELVQQNARHMGRLIDDLLKFSQLGRKALSLQPIDTAEVARTVLETLEGEMHGRVVEVSIGPLPNCSGDPVLLRQVFVNLLSNALKYSRDSDPASIEVGSEGSDESEVVYFVRDNGAGFDMRYAGKLFGVFQRLHRADEFEGTGVGLALVHRILARHGCRIWAEGEVGKGATFYFTLPRGAH